MATLRDIKSRIRSVSSIERITSAMKMVAFVKSKKVQKQAEEARPYTKKIAYTLKLILNSDADIIADHPLFKPKNEVVKNIAVVVVASDKGMCGSFNSNLFKQIELYLKNEIYIKYPEAKLHIIAVGNKAVDYFNKRNYDVIASFNNAFQSLDFTMVERLKKVFYEKFLIGEIDRVEIYFNRFVNVLKQDPTFFPLLPIDISIKPEDSDKIYDYIFEPDKKMILDTLINQYLDVSIWTSLLESNASEQSARLIAMDKATQNANELIKDLQLQYNNARQAAITTEMLEIVGGAEALRKL